MKNKNTQAIYPSAQHVKLTQNEKANICYMSFPDSNSGFLGDTQHHFRIKQDQAQTRSSIYDEYNQKTLTSLEVL